MDGLNKRVEITEDRISELEVSAAEFTQSEQQRENRLEKKNRASGNLWDSNKSSSIHIISVQKESREKEVLKEDSKK